MYRRDFTINTMALCLNPNVFGELIDFFGGRKDLRHKAIRILHTFSFIEDPTRVVRAIRFSRRYDFRLEDHTARLLLDATERGMLARLSAPRLLHELVMLLRERDPAPALRQLGRLGIWPAILPEVPYETIDFNAFKRLFAAEAWWRRHGGGAYERWIVYMTLLVCRLPEADVAGVLAKYDFTRHARTCIRQGHAVLAGLKQISALSENRVSSLRRYVEDWRPESAVFSLAVCEAPAAYKRLTAYFARAAAARVETDGSDLARLGLPPGPFYGIVLSRLLDARLDQTVASYEEEIALVERWIQEGESAFE
jgi:tRNA nucleotidyltransferase (CCA-adding enzyme)